ncbi:unnamed protein product, partial [Brassica oleracea]
INQPVNDVVGSRLVWVARWIASLHKAHQITGRSPTISVEFSRLSG